MTYSREVEEPTITPWEVKGRVDYEKVRKEFGAEEIGERVLKLLPHPVLTPLKRGFFYAHRDFDKWIKDWKDGRLVSVVTGRGPSGEMHLGHILPFYAAKWFQERMGAHLVIPLSDDEKYVVKEKPFREIAEYTYNNLVEILAVGFDKERTRIVIDTRDTWIYPLSVAVGKRFTYSTVRALFGLQGSENIAWVFYPAVQTVHLFLPQLIWEPHRVLVPVAIDQDPYIRVARDIAEKMGLVKTAGLLSKFMPSLESPEGKMSTTGESKVIWLTDGRETVREKIMKYAFSGGRPTLEEHRKYGGNPWIDVSFLYLFYFFEEDDRKIEEIRKRYESGEMTTGELKEIAAEKIADFLEEHQKRKEKVMKRDFEDLIEEYAIMEDEKERALSFMERW